MLAGLLGWLLRALHRIIDLLSIAVHLLINWLALLLLHLTGLGHYLVAVHLHGLRDLLVRLFFMVLLDLLLVDTLVFIHLHHLLMLLSILVLLKGWEPLRGSAHMHLLVDVRLGPQVSLVLLDSQVHHLEVFACIVLVSLVTSVARHALTKNLNLLLKIVLFVAHRVDTPDQVDVVFHEARVVLTVLLQVASQLIPVVDNLGLVHLAIVCMLSVLICSLLAVGLLLDPGLVKSNDSSLKFFVVRDMLDYFEDVVPEALLLDLLHVELVTGVQILVLKTLVAHLEIAHNEVQVGTDSVEVLHLNLHLSDLLVEGGDVVLAGQDVPLQLLDLVVEHELKLLQLLRLLLQFDDAGILIQDRGEARL